MHAQPKILLLFCLTINVSGCASLSDFCEDHSKGCLLTGEALGAVVVGGIAIEATRRDEIKIVPNKRVTTPNVHQ